MQEHANTASEWVVLGIGKAEQITVTLLKEADRDPGRLRVQVECNSFDLCYSVDSLDEVRRLASSSGNNTMILSLGKIGKSQVSLIRESSEAIALVVRSQCGDRIAWIIDESVVLSLSAAANGALLDAN